jgi:hypothetical protein
MPISIINGNISFFPECQAWHQTTTMISSYQHMTVHSHLCNIDDEIEQ